jgi:hypothetical protein
MKFECPHCGFPYTKGTIIREVSIFRNQLVEQIGTIECRCGTTFDYKLVPKKWAWSKDSLKYDHASFTNIRLPNPCKEIELYFDNPPAMEKYIHLGRSDIKEHSKNKEISDLTKDDFNNLDNDRFFYANFIMFEAFDDSVLYVKILKSRYGSEGTFINIG